MPFCARSHVVSSPRDRCWRRSRMATQSSSRRNRADVKGHGLPPFNRETQAGTANHTTLMTEGTSKEHLQRYTHVLPGPTSSLHQWRQRFHSARFPGRSRTTGREPGVERVRSGRYAQGRVCPHLGWEARAMGRQRPPLRGWEIYHMKGSPAEPNPSTRPSPWLVRPSHAALGRRRRAPGAVGNEFAYDGEAGTHQWYDGTPHPWEFKRVWHVEPSRPTPTRLRRGRGRRSLQLDRWRRLLARDGRPARARHGSSWSPGAGGMGLHTILLDPKDANRIFVAISAAGVFRTDDGGETWRPTDHGLKWEYIPDPTPRSATACTASRCTRRGRMSFSCRSTGT